MRIVSLIASSTEIVCALGLEDHLVGRSHECDFPPSVTRLPVLTAPKFPVEGSSKEIDRHVKSIVAKALAVYDVNAEGLAALAPDVILTQSQCEVCAVSLKDVEQAVCEVVISRPRIVSLESNALADVWRDIRRVADALDVHAKGEALVAHLKARMDGLADRVRTLPSRPTVACLEWIDPLMAAGNWMPELVEMAGGVNLFGQAGKHSPWMDWEELQLCDPEILVALPCGFDLERTRKEMRTLTQRPRWNGLRSAQTGRVYVTDGNQYFNRPGPRLVESLEILAELFHPESFSFGHRGVAWQELCQEP